MKENTKEKESVKEEETKEVVENIKNDNLIPCLDDLIEDPVFKKNFEITKRKTVMANHTLNVFNSIVSYEILKTLKRIEGLLDKKDNKPKSKKLGK